MVPSLLLSRRTICWKLMPIEDNSQWNYVRYVHEDSRGASKPRKRVSKIMTCPQRVNKTMADATHKHTGIVVAIGSGKQPSIMYDIDHCCAALQVELDV